MKAVTLKPCIVCGTPGRGPRCPAHGGDRRAMTTSQRGYGAAHRRRRKQLLVFAIGMPCPVCGETMRADQRLDLDHTTPLIDNPFSIGDRIVHATCNRGQAGVSQPQRAITTPSSRVRIMIVAECSEPTNWAVVL